MVENTTTLAPPVEALFTVGTRPAWVCEDDAIVTWLDRQGLRAMSRAEAFDRASDLDAMVLITTRFTQPKDGAPSTNLREIFRGTQVLWVPLASFDGSFASAAYTLDLLRRSDPRRTMARNRAWQELYASAEGPFRFTGPGTDLTCRLRDAVMLATRVLDRLGPGEWESIGNLFEVNVEDDASRTGGDPFLADGHVSVDGLAAARHHVLPPDAQARHTAATELVTDVARSGRPIVLEVAGAQVQACWVGDDDIVATIRDLTNPAHEGRCREYAVGTNHEILPHIDWSRNSQLNEGAEGMHFGVGEGRTGAHIDFISSTARLTSHRLEPSDG